ncbi:tryptophanase [Deltaproteobacteria bacterium OttesenSCG-928-M10]|nr:tryptophanase [Deltaproteobacteria bacterium OttesenSCG-928-M10]
MAIKYIPEPFRIKSVEPLKMLTRSEREEKIRQARYNLFNLRGEDCYIDLLTDSGTNAMSQNQWAGIMSGDEAYAGASSYYKLLAAAKDIFGHGFFQPVHQGRAAEKVLFPILLGPGKFAVSNMFFDTTRAHVQLAGARAVDCVVDEAKDPAKRAPFKGNMDLLKLEKTIKERGPENIGLVVMTITNNSAGGQPVSMKNIKDTAEICRRYGLPFSLDAARFAENAFFIRRDEPGYADKPVIDIVREMFGAADFFTMSAKKDAIVNIGGLIGVKDPENPVILKVKANCISFEGFTSYGGLAGRDLEALAVGLYEGIDYEQLRYRVGQVEYLAARLDDAGVRYQAPAGGHGVFVDAAAMFPHIAYHEFPGQVLGVELYKEAGIRTSEIGSYMLGNDPDTGAQLKADFEFSRLAIPRRVYTQAHFDIMAEALIAVAERAPSIKRGYRITWEPPILRHFQAFLEPIAD